MPQALSLLCSLACLTTPAAPHRNRHVGCIPSGHTQKSKKKEKGGQKNKKRQKEEKESMRPAHVLQLLAQRIVPRRQLRQLAELAHCTQEITPLRRNNMCWCPCWH